MVKKNIDTISLKHSNELTNRNEKRSVLDKVFTARANNKDNQSVVGSIASEKIKIHQAAAQLVEKVFADASVNFQKKHVVNRQLAIDELRSKIEGLQEQIRQLVEKSRNSRINFATDEEEFGEEEPAGIPGLRSQKLEEDGQPNGGKAHQLFKTEEQKLKELRETLEDLCDASINQIAQQREEGLQVDVWEEKMHFLAKAKALMQEVFKVIVQINSASKRKVDEFQTRFVWEVDLMDFEILKSKYLEKLKELMDFVNRIKENTDFFNTGIDDNVVRY